MVAFPRVAASVSVGMAAILLAVSTPAWAQVPGGRSSGGLFGQTTEASGPQTLNVTFDLAGAYDDDLFSVGAAPTVGNGAAPVHGYYSMLTSATEYARQGRRLQFGLNASSTLRYYGQLKVVRNVNSAIGAGFGATLPGRITWRLNQSATYSPSYLYGLFPDASTPSPGELPTTSAPDYTVTDTASYAYGTSTSVTHGLTRRGTLTIAGDLALTDFIHNAPDRKDMTSYGARVEFGRRVTRHGAARLAYRFRGGDAGFGGTSSVEHAIEMGFQIERPLSATRRATLSFALGPSTVNVPVSAVQAAPDAQAGERRLYRVRGSATAGYQFGRSWEARASYNRGLEYVPGLTAAVLTGGVTSSLDGLLSRRVDLKLSAGYSDGRSALSRASTYKTYTGDLRLRFAVTREWAFYGEYLYYYYDFRGGTQLLSGFPPKLERNGVRAGLTLWLPVVR